MTVLACPNCDHTGLQNLVDSGIHGSNESGKNYSCRKCGHHFDEPVERQPKSPDHKPGYLAGKLLQMDADDVGGDSTTERRQAGGR